MNTGRKEHKPDGRCFVEGLRHETYLLPADARPRWTGVARQGLRMDDNFGRRANSRQKAHLRPGHEGCPQEYGW